METSEYPLQTMSHFAKHLVSFYINTNPNQGN